MLYLQTYKKYVRVDYGNSVLLRMSIFSNRSLSLLPQGTWNVLGSEFIILFFEVIANNLSFRGLCWIENSKLI